MTSARPLRIGLLVCDHVLPEFRHVAGDYTDMFDRLFAGRAVEVVPFDLQAGEFPDDLYGCDVWMTTGSRHSVYEQEEWIVRLAELVRQIHDEGVPFVGVCFGHQMIAHALGGRVARSDRGWGVGVKTVRIDHALPWMGGDRSYRIINSHADQIEELPDGAVVLGGNEHCPVSMMALGDRILGVQGHPEFTPAYSSVLMEARRGRLIPDDVVDAARATLDEPLDSDLLVDWILAFAHGDEDPIGVRRAGRSPSRRAP